MSGGANRKKSSKVQGWEDAGIEFYQENYLSNDVELQDVLQRDPKHLATLLPSKQNRAYSTMRMRCTDTKSRTVRRTTATRSRKENSMRRPSAAAEVQVAMLPDLSEPISNEQTAWEQIMRIKELPITMAEKREMKMKIQNSPNLRLQGYEQFKWKRRKLIQRFRQTVAEIRSKLELWRGHMKHMEGHFGTGTVAYFQFIKWLIFFNLATFLLIFLFLITPTISAPQQNITCNDNSTTDITPINSECCLASYLNDSFNLTMDFLEVFKGIVQGGGFMEYTLFFYGNYTFKLIPYKIFNATFYYSLPLAYVTVTCFLFVASLFIIVRELAKSFRYKIIEGEGQFYRYCNLTFGSWDFCIRDEKAAAVKKKAIFNEVRSYLDEERHLEEKKNRTKQERMKIVAVCVTINIVEFGILVGCAWLIYAVFSFSSGRVSESLTEFEVLFFEFLPSLTIVCLNIFLPMLFKRLIVYERYSPSFSIQILLVRTIFLRLSSVIVFYGSMYSVINRSGENCFNSEYKCWETFVGRHIYRLILTDFAIQILITFFLNFPRSLLEKHFQNKFTKFIGEQNFDLPKHVLDIVYLQTLCWLGTFYAPMISSLFVIILFVLFYIKKFACTVNSKPSRLVHRASTSTSMFMSMLLIALIVAAFPVIYTIGEITPSRSCGPFRGQLTVWESVYRALEKTPAVIRIVASYTTTAAVAVPAFVVLILLLYYYTAVNNANRHMVRVLKDQLILEGHDKQFLLERLSMFIKQQQESLKHLRRYDGDMNLANLSSSH